MLEDSVRAVLIEFTDVIEHLKIVEVQILLELMWSAGSPLLRRYVNGEGKDTGADTPAGTRTWAQATLSHRSYRGPR